MKNDNVRIFLLALVVVAIIGGTAYLILKNGGLLASFAPYSQGVTVVGLSDVAVLSNYDGLAGPWWLSTVLLGGGQTLNVQNPGGQTTSASTLDVNSSYVCNGQCQSDNLQVSALYSYLDYPLSAAGTAVDQYNVTYLGGGSKQLSYATCYNQNIEDAALGNTQGMPQVTNTSSQLENFGNCSNNAAQQQAYTNYYQVCKTDGGTPLVEKAGSSSTFFTINVGGIGIPIKVNSGATVGCYQLQATPIATVYGLSSTVPSYEVRVVMNGQSSTITNNQAQNTTNPNLLLFNIGSGFSYEAAPSETTVSVVQYAKNGTALIEGNSGTGIVSEESVVQSGLETNFGDSQSLANATNYVSAANKQGGAALVNSYVNTQFKNASLTCSTPSPLAIGCIGGVQYVKLPDPTMLYTRPEVSMMIKASLVGLYLGVSQFNITSVSVPNFRSGSNSYAYVQLKNTGSAQGGYAVTGTSQTGVTIIPSSQSGFLSPGNQTTLTFTLQDNANINSNTSESISFQLCPSPQVSGTSCQTVTKSFTLAPQCSSNVAYNASNCKPLTTITVPTTTVPGSNTTVPTTTVLCNPTTGVGCSGTSGGNNTDLEIGIIAAIVISAIIIALAVRNKGGGGSRTSSGRSYNPNTGKYVMYVILGIVGLVAIYLLGVYIIALVFLGILGLIGYFVVKKKLKI